MTGRCSIVRKSAGLLRSLCSAPTASCSALRVTPGQVSPRLAVPEHVERPPYANTGSVPRSGPNRIIIHDAKSIGRMRDSCKMAVEAREFALSLAKPGVTTDEIDRRTHEFIVQKNAYPSPLNYMGFPKSVCTSRNEVICHGIPDDSELHAGDIMNIDVSVYWRGFHGDTSDMVVVGGSTSPERQAVVDAARRAMYDGISVCVPGASFPDIGSAVQRVADAGNYGLPEGFAGHGIGREFHIPPHIFHFSNDVDFGPMKEGMIFTVEPMINVGTAEWEAWDDNWTIVTKDASASAQAEHTILVTADGPEILTVC